MPDYTAPPVCPPLGTGSIDFDAVHAAAKRGDDLNEAIEAAREGGPPEPAPEPEPAKPLCDLTKADLIALAEAEGVDLTGAANNDERVAAIEAARLSASGQAVTPGI